MSIQPRMIQPLIQRLATSYPVLTLLGPRQSGKTTLVKEVFANKPYVSLENPAMRQFAQDDPLSFLAQYPDGAVLDEVQRAPWLLSYIQGIVDDNQKKSMFILTGSHQQSLHESISQSLAGRTVMLKLLPYSLQELPEHAHQKELDFYLYHGMYPRVYQDNLDPPIFYSSYLQTYVEKDVRQMINIKDLGLFQRFIKLCASRIGQVFNAQSMANDLGLSGPTINQWLSILEASFVLFRLQPYFENFGKRLIKSPKLYFYDVGLATYCLDIHRQEQLIRDPLRGQLAENFVITELIKNRLNQGLESNAYFYRDSNQNEVDLIFKSGHFLYPVEIKSSKTYNSAFVKSLNQFKSLVGDRCPKGWLIYTGDHEQKIGEIDVINFHHCHRITDEII